MGKKKKDRGARKGPNRALKLNDRPSLAAITELALRTVFMDPEALAAPVRTDARVWKYATRVWMVVLHHKPDTEASMMSWIARTFEEAARYFAYDEEHLFERLEVKIVPSGPLRAEDWQDVCLPTGERLPQEVAEHPTAEKLEPFGIVFFDCGGGGAAFDQHGRTWDADEMPLGSIRLLIDELDRYEGIYERYPWFRALVELVNRNDVFADRLAEDKAAHLSPTPNTQRTVRLIMDGLNELWVTRNAITRKERDDAADALFTGGFEMTRVEYEKHCAAGGAPEDFSWRKVQDLGVALYERGVEGFRINRKRSCVRLVALAARTLREKLREVTATMDLRDEKFPEALVAVAFPDSNGNGNGLAIKVAEALRDEALAAVNNVEGLIKAADAARAPAQTTSRLDAIAWNAAEEEVGKYVRLWLRALHEMEGHWKQASYDFERSGRIEEIETEVVFTDPAHTRRVEKINFVTVVSDSLVAGRYCRYVCGTRTHRPAHVILQLSTTAPTKFTLSASHIKRMAYTDASGEEVRPSIMIGHLVQAIRAATVRLNGGKILDPSLLYARGNQAYEKDGKRIQLSFYAEFEMAGDRTKTNPSMPTSGLGREKLIDIVRRTLEGKPLDADPGLACNDEKPSCSRSCRWYGDMLLQCARFRASHKTTD